MACDARFQPWRARVHRVGLGVVARRGERELLAGVSGCNRLSPAVCGECARKLLWERAFSLVSALSPMVCKSIA